RGANMWLTPFTPNASSNFVAIGFAALGSNTSNPGISPADDDAVDAGDGADGERHPAKQPAAIVHARRLTKQNRRAALRWRLLNRRIAIDASRRTSSSLLGGQPWQIRSCSPPARYGAADNATGPY